MSQSAARATAMILLHDATQTIVAAERVLSGGRVLDEEESIRRELFELLCRTTAVVQRLSTARVVNERELDLGSTAPARRTRGA